MFVIFYGDIRTGLRGGSKVCAGELGRGKWPAACMKGHVMERCIKLRGAYAKLRVPSALTSVTWVLEPVVG